jgi:hypothetical protein
MVAFAADMQLLFPHKVIGSRSNVALNRSIDSESAWARHPQRSFPSPLKAVKMLAGRPEFTHCPSVYCHCFSKHHQIGLQ